MTIEEVLSLYEQIIEPAFVRLDAQETQTYLSKFSPGYGYLHAIFQVNNLMRGDGLSGFYSTSAWSLIWPAMKGAYEFGLVDLGDCLKTIIYHYHKSGRSKMKKIIPSNFFEGFHMDESLKPDDLFGKYLDLYRHLNPKENRWIPSDLLPQIIGNNSGLFTPPIFNIKPFPDALYCFISKNITKKNEKIELCIKFEVDDPKQSGWQFYGETETDKQQSDPNHLTMCSLNIAAIFEPTILEFYNEAATPKIAFCREESGLFVRKL